MAAVDTSIVQMNLAGQAPFRERIQYLLTVQAQAVLAEDPKSEYYDQRVAYAREVIKFPAEYAGKSATLVVSGAPVIAATTWNTNLSTAGFAVCTITDAALLAQLGAQWNTLAGVGTGKDLNP